MSREVYPLVVPRLQFGGQCAEALELYQKVFGATVKEKILFSQANPSDFQYMGKEKDHFIYYAELMIGKHMVMMHDDVSGTAFNSRHGATALCVSFGSEEKARAAYELLLDGASILMPITSTSYGVFEVSLADKFGIVWDLYFGDA